MNIDHPCIPQVVRDLAARFVNFDPEDVHVWPNGECVVISLPWDCPESAELLAAGFTQDVCTEGLRLGEQDWCWRLRHPTPHARRFGLHRYRDVTGVSGTGMVAEGVQFADGTVVLRWRGENPSTVLWSSLVAAMRVHCHGGATCVSWLD